MAWLAYTSTGELPSQVRSADMDLPGLAPGTYAWLEHLTADQRRRFEAALPAHREFQRLQRPERRDAWLAKDDGRGVRQAAYELMRAGHRAGEALRKVGERAMKAAGATILRQPPPLAAKASDKSQSARSPVKQRPDKAWLQYLDDRDRARAEELLPSYNAYNRRRKRPAELDAWLAVGGKEGERRRERWAALHKKSKEYQRLIGRAKRNMENIRRREQAARNQQDVDAKGKVTAYAINVAGLYETSISGQRANTSTNQ